MSEPQETEQVIEISTEDRITLLETELAAKVGSEARGICFCTVYGVKKDADGNLHTVQINMTQRSDAGAKEALAEFLDALKFAGTKKLYPWPPSGVQVNARGDVRRDTEQIQLPDEQLSTPTTPLPAAPVTHDEPTTETSGKFLCVKMEVVPVAGGKVTLKLFSNDKKQPVNDFPTMTTTQTIQGAISKLTPTGPWTDQHFAKPTSWNVKFNVAWVQGKEYSPGKHYKDITITPA